MKHYKIFYGRPKKDLLSLQKQILTGIGRNSLKIDRQEDRIQRILKDLSVADHKVLEDYINRREDLFALYASQFIIDWVMGEGLSKQVFLRNFDTPWGEEFIDEFTNEN